MPIRSTSIGEHWLGGRDDIAHVMRGCVSGTVVLVVVVGLVEVGWKSGV